MDCVQILHVASLIKVSILRGKSNSSFGCYGNAFMENMDYTSKS